MLAFAEAPTETEAFVEAEAFVDAGVFRSKIRQAEAVAGRARGTGRHVHKQPKREAGKVRGRESQGPQYVSDCTDLGLIFSKFSGFCPDSLDWPRKAKKI